MSPQESPMLATRRLAENDCDGVSAIQGPNLLVAPTSPVQTDNSRLSQIFSAATKGSLAIVGQGLFAGANFIANVLLARWLTPEQYGAFALAYSCFLLFLMLYSACVYEPLIVFGSGRYAGRFEDYFGALVRGNLYVLAALSCLMVATSFLLSALFPAGVARDFAALSVAAPFVLITWLGRGGFYSRLKPAEAALGSAGYFLTLLSLLAAFRLEGRLSGSTAFLGMGVAGLVASTLLFSRLRFRWRGAVGSLRVNEVASEHWRYGRWALGAAVVSWFPQNIYYAVLPAKAGLEGAAAMRALTNLTTPVLHTLISLAAVVIPVLVRHHQQGGIEKMKKTMKILTVLLVPGSIVYLGLLWSGRSILFKLLYSGKYEQYNGWPLLLTALTPIAATVAMIVASALRALQKPETIFWSYTMATAAAIVFGFPLTIHLGVLGATGALLISNVAPAVVMILYFRRASSEAVYR